MTDIGKVAVVAFVIVVASLAISVQSVRAVADGCAVVLRTPDGFLVVRAGPGVRHREVDRIYEGQIIVTKHVSDSRYAGDWWRISGILESIGDKIRPIQGCDSQQVCSAGQLLASNRNGLRAPAFALRATREFGGIKIIPLEQYADKGLEKSACYPSTPFCCRQRFHPSPNLQNSWVLKPSCSSPETAAYRQKNW